MADVSGITAVKPGTGASVTTGVYGATVTIGQLLYKDASDGKLKLADSDLSEAAATAIAIAVTPGIDGEKGVIITDGSVILTGATLVVGGTYCASATAGGIKPESEVATSQRVTIVGVAATATQLNLSFLATNIVHA